MRAVPTPKRTDGVAQTSLVLKHEFIARVCAHAARAEMPRDEELNFFFLVLDANNTRCERNDRVRRADGAETTASLGAVRKCSSLNAPR